MLEKSLCTAEQVNNSFVRTVIQKVAPLSNVKWRHRSIYRLEFCINGFLSRHFDFFVYSNNGYIVTIETKGVHLTSNDDSRDKAELGKLWQARAGSKFRYYMVSEETIASNSDATDLDKFLEIMKDL